VSDQESAAYLNALARAIHAGARAKGFYDREFVADPESRYDNAIPNPSFPAEKLLLIVSEVSETLDALRDADPDHEAEELADVIIRCLDYAAWRGVDVDAAVAAKVATNRDRPRLHGRAGF
jgi:NTP pyrophosphatase (non-canonical NTP hydrolase)